MGNIPLNTVSRRLQDLECEFSDELVRWTLNNVAQALQRWQMMQPPVLTTDDPRLRPTKKEPTRSPAVIAAARARALARVADTSPEAAAAAAAPAVDRPAKGGPTVAQLLSGDRASRETGDSDVPAAEPTTAEAAADSESAIPPPPRRASLVGANALRVSPPKAASTAAGTRGARGDYRGMLTPLDTDTLNRRDYWSVFTDYSHVCNGAFLSLPMRLFEALCPNSAGHVSTGEFFLLLTLFCDGDLDDRMSFLFWVTTGHRLADQKSIDLAALHRLLRSMFRVLFKLGLVDVLPDPAYDNALAQESMRLADLNKDGVLSKEEFTSWAVNAMRSQRLLAPFVGEQAKTRMAERKRKQEKAEKERMIAVRRRSSMPGVDELAATAARGRRSSLLKGAGALAAARLVLDKRATYANTGVDSQVPGAAPGAPNTMLSPRRRMKRKGAVDTGQQASRTTDSPKTPAKRSGDASGAELALKIAERNSGTPAAELDDSPKKRVSGVRGLLAAGDKAARDKAARTNVREPTTRRRGSTSITFVDDDGSNVVSRATDTARRGSQSSNDDKRSRSDSKDSPPQKGRGRSRTRGRGGRGGRGLRASRSGGRIARSQPPPTGATSPGFRDDSATRLAGGKSGSVATNSRSSVGGFDHDGDPTTATRFDESDDGRPRSCPPAEHADFEQHVHEEMLGAMGLKFRMQVRRTRAAKLRTVATKRVLAALLGSANFSRPELVSLAEHFTDASSVTGTLDRDTFKSVLTKYAPKLSKTEDVMDRVYDVFDADGNGLVSYKELVMGLSKIMRGTLHQKLELLFRIHDKDGDGQIDLMELVGLIRQSSTDLYDVIQFSQEIMSSLDIDGNGAIDPNEFSLALNREPVLMRTFVNCISIPLDAGRALHEFKQIHPLFSYTKLSEMVDAVMEEEPALVNRTFTLMAFKVFMARHFLTAKPEHQALESIFNAFDEARQGVISVREVINGMGQVLCSTAEAQAAFFFRLFDMDRSGTLETNEIMHMLLASQQKSNKNAAIVIRTLHRLDADASGTISTEEFVHRATRDEVLMQCLENLLEVRAIHVGDVRRRRLSTAVDDNPGAQWDATDGGRSVVGNAMPRLGGHTISIESDAERKAARLSAGMAVHRRTARDAGGAGGGGAGGKVTLLSLPRVARGVEGAASGGARGSGQGTSSRSARARGYGDRDRPASSYTAGTPNAAYAGERIDAEHTGGFSGVNGFLSERYRQRMMKASIPRYNPATDALRHTNGTLSIRRTGTFRHAKLDAGHSPAGSSEAHAKTMRGSGPPQSPVRTGPHNAVSPRKFFGFGASAYTPGPNLNGSVDHRGGHGRGISPRTKRARVAAQGSEAGDPSEQPSRVGGRPLEATLSAIGTLARTSSQKNFLDAHYEIESSRRPDASANLATPAVVEDSEPGLIPVAHARVNSAVPAHWNPAVAAAPGLGLRGDQAARAELSARAAPYLRLIGPRHTAQTHNDPLRPGGKSPRTYFQTAHVQPDEPSRRGRVAMVSRSNARVVAHPKAAAFGLMQGSSAAATDHTYVRFGKNPRKQDGIMRNATGARMRVPLAAGTNARARAQGTAELASLPTEFASWVSDLPVMHSPVKVEPEYGAADSGFRPSGPVDPIRFGGVTL